MADDGNDFNSECECGCGCDEESDALLGMVEFWRPFPTNGLTEREDAIEKFLETFWEEFDFSENERDLVREACQDIRKLASDDHLEARRLVDAIFIFLEQPEHEGKIWNSECLYRQLLRVLIAGEQLQIELARRLDGG